MLKQEPIEAEIDLTGDSTPLKRERSPIDIDMLSVGNKDVPIVIIDSDSDAEVDMQMDEDDEGARDELMEDKTEESELEYMEVQPKAQEKTVDAEDDEVEEEPTGYLPEEASKEPSEDPPGEASKDLLRESSEEPSRELSKESTQEVYSVVSTRVPSTEPEEQEQLKAKAEVMAERSSERSESREIPTETLEKSPTPDPFEQARRDSTPAPGTPPDERAPAGEDREATPRPQVPISPVPSLSSSSSSSGPEEPDEATARHIDFLRPKPNEFMLPATQPAPLSTKKRAFAAVAADAPPPPSSLPTPKPVPRRREFLRTPVSKPTPVTVPLLRVSGSTSTAKETSERPDSISSDEDARQAKRVKTTTSPTAIKRAPVQTPRSTSQGPGATQHVKTSRRPTKHAEHWHIDGSVVLQLGGVAFRLHRSRLSQQSTFLAKLFHDGREGREIINVVFEERVTRAKRQGSMDDQPLYVIDGVAPDDFAKLLNALDNAINYIFQPPEFPDLAALLRASLALSFTALSTFATRTLETMWPSSMPTLAVHPNAKHAEETVVLARTCGLPSLLKSAFYELLRAPGLGQSVEQEFLLDGANEERARRKVPPADLARLIKTREELAAQWARAAALPPDPREFGCSSFGGRQCAVTTVDAVRLWREAVHASDLYIEYMHDPIAGLERLCDLGWVELGFCKNCVGAWCASWARQREKVWANLELWLELPRKEEEEEL
ncbi:uncharacterized protein PHACADRAFT_187594 [Phanerochaete carnosa HHB-10118-sp]|uniref:BTB domain-containing protein n=1 Tax=Phanerochaete carnosa (strain HHB-10118-sp) TaxID=650164 RepID=K5VWK5_PHACS|nr:uncharacterized protein PHACADRAFT_187594 [Phanerochaete carnosa HHB-10118-sp]EKM50974.1 hypothetical protein PHACADRAFT_187594 [Phanerochaete carnosa HHB-10118-sp]